MHLALITPRVVDQPTTGYSTRQYQLQHALERIAPGGVTYWEIANGRPAASGGMPTEPSRGASMQRRSASSPLGTLRNAVALSLFLWPSFNIRSVGDQRSRILTWVDEEQPTHAIIVHPQATELTRSLSQRGIRVFVYCHDAASDLARQMVAVAPPGPRKLAALLNWRAITRWEKQYFPIAEEIWVVSDIDAKRIDRVCGGRARIRTVPNAIDVAAYQPVTVSGSNDIVLPAYFGTKMSGYSPDAAAAEILRDRILPTVQREVPDARLILLGRDPEGLARQLQRDPDVIATGELPDTKPYLRQSGVVVVPILHGSGTRYKILEALALGLPVVSTPLGAEGLEVRDGEHLLIRDLDGFAGAIVAILRDPAYGARLGRAGRKLVEEKYSWDVVERILREALGSMPDRTLQQGGAAVALGGNGAP